MKSKRHANRFSSGRPHVNNPAVSRMNTCHVIVEQIPNYGTWNMAVDEALLNAASADGQCWLRWYRWSAPTISLGYFQSESVPDEYANLPVVKRLSGGGAILHHHELTYAAAIPRHHELAQTPADLYRAIHDQIIAVMAEFGITAHRRGAAAEDHDGRFLCFQREDPNDVVCGRHKIVGSAQRRRRGAVLQHGSVLLRRSDFAQELAGLEELGLKSPPVGLLQTRLAACVAARLGESESVETLPESLKQVAEQIEQNRYRTDRTLSPLDSR